MLTRRQVRTRTRQAVVDDAGASARYAERASWLGASIVSPFTRNGEATGIVRRHLAEATGRHGMPFPARNNQDVFHATVSFARGEL